MNSTKYTIIAYIFAFLGGLFGLHHLYLGRTQHALLWFTTFGGFGIGLIYEIFFSIRFYVREANGDQQIFDQHKKQLEQQKSPAFDLRRIIGQYLTGLFYGFITFYAFPDTWLEYRLGNLIVLLATLVAVSFGVQIVGTLSARQCPFRWTFLGSLLGSTFSVLRGDNPFSLSVIALVCCLIFQWKVEWNPDYLYRSNKSPTDVNERVRRRHFVKRCLIFGFGAVLFCSIVSCAIYQNLQVDINGERVKIKDVLQSFFNSPQYLQLCQQLSGVFKQMWSFYLQYGFKGLWTHIWSILDLEGEKKALDTLDLKADATQDEIKNKCRSLSGKWHPDRFRDPDEKQNAEITFMNIQQACDRLSKGRKRRQIINTQKRENPK